MAIFKTKTAKALESVQKELEETKEAFREIRDENRGWTSLNDVQGSTTDLSSENHRKQQEAAREAFMFAPAGKRQVKYTTAYIMGKGFEITSSNKAVQYIIDRFIKNPLNRWKKQTKEWMNREQTDGETFITLYVGEDGSSLSRETDPFEIVDILTDPEDVNNPILYKRVYNSITYANGEPDENEKTEYIRSLTATDEEIGELNFDAQHMAMISEKKRIYHIKTLTYSNRKRGLSDFSATLYYLSRLRQSIDTGLKLDKLKQGFWLDVKVTGNKDQVTAEAAKSQYKRPPKAGSTLFHNDNIEVDIVQPDMNHKDSNEALEPILRQITMGSGMPEWMLLGMANMFKAGATEQSAPFIKLIEDYQEQWEEDFINIFTFIVLSVLGGNKDRTQLKDTGGIKSLLSEIDENNTVTVMELNEDGEEVVKKENGIDVRVPFWETIQIQFPEIIVRDENKESDAVTKDLGNKLVSRETASVKRGYDYKTEEIKIKLEEKEALKNNPLLSEFESPEDNEEEQEKEEE